MDQLQHTRKMRIIAILVLYLEILNGFIMMLMLACTYIIDDYLKHNNNRTWDAYTRHLVREVNFDRVIFFF